eukprot:10131783-Heterocapsa_arctica.AAC.1
MPASSDPPQKKAIGAIERVAELAEPEPARPGIEHRSALNQFASVELMMDRLRELGAPIYGMKAEKWARVLKAESEIAKEEEIRKLIEERQIGRRDQGE